MAKKKALPKKATKKVTPKKATPKKKESKKESLDFSLVFVGSGSKKDDFDITLDIKGNSLSLGVALGQLMTEDKNLEDVFRVAIDYYVQVINKKVKPISKVLKGKKPKK